MLCNICPRKCNIDRDLQLGFCKQSNSLKVARAALHRWEEPCISAQNGSGTVFFSGCNMRCVFCQNKDISAGGFGKVITEKELCDIFLSLQSQNAHNINLVTPTHFCKQIINAVALAKTKGLCLPIIYNTSGYENPETIAMLKDTVDIFLTDFKYFDSSIAVKYSAAADYKQVAQKALKQMHILQPNCVFDKNGVMQKGVIVRVLVLPSHNEDAKQIIKYLHDNYKDDIFISIMSQYTPVGDLSCFKELNRKLSVKEYDEVVDFACDIGVENGFVQQGDSASESFIPPFELQGV